MRFTLVYGGDLPPNANAQQKWHIRRTIEPQLRRLWTVPPFDSVAKYQDPSHLPNDCYVGETSAAIEYVPFISAKLEMRAGLYIRLLSSSMPGGLVRCGDIDNRLKTLLDALTIPNRQQVPDQPDLESDGRLFCLLQDDRLVTRIDVANDRLLTAQDHSTETLVLIEVQPIAFNVTLANIGIAV